MENRPHNCELLLDDSVTVDAAEVNQQPYVEESRQWLENVNQARQQVKNGQN